MPYLILPRWRFATRVDLLPSERDTLDGYRTLGTVSTVGFAVAGVGAVAGLGLWLWAPDAESGAPAAALAVTPDGLTAWGRF